MKLKMITWIKYLNRLINFFIVQVLLKMLLLNEKEWKVKLYHGNNPTWIQPHLSELVDEITIIRNQIDLKSPKIIIVV